MQLIAQLAEKVQAKLDTLATQIVADQDLDDLRRSARPHDDVADGPRGPFRTTYNSWGTL